MTNRFFKYAPLVLVCILILGTIGLGIYYAFAMKADEPFGLSVRTEDMKRPELRAEDGFLFDDIWGNGNGSSEGSTSLIMRNCKVRVSGTVSCGTFRLRIYDEAGTLKCDYTLPFGTYYDQCFEVGDLGHAYKLTCGVAEDVPFAGDLSISLITYSRGYERFLDQFAR